MLQVKNHNKFRRFDYINEKSNIKLGTVITKVERDGNTEIGVVIQVHGQNEYRTDMYGNGYLNDKYEDVERFATIEEVTQFRPELLKDLKK